MWTRWSPPCARSTTTFLKRYLQARLFLSLQGSLVNLLDCDGRIGGFNFQWAWATGFLAGRAVSASVCADGEARR